MNRSNPHTGSRSGRPYSRYVVRSLAVLAALAAATATAQTTEFAYPPTADKDVVRARVDRVAPEHPRLFADQARFDQLRAALDENTLRGALADAVIRQATRLQDESPITRQLQGRRLLGQSRRCVQRVLTLAMAYQLTGDRSHLERGEQEMLAVARFSDWNPSHFLDVAEMTLALAVGYDWCFDGLDPASREEIRTAIVRKGVVLPFETKHKGWVRASNNWGQVCHGGLTVGALAVLEDEPELATRTIHNALHNVTRSMAAYAPAGSYPEGPGYWAYGTSYNVLLIDALETVLGTDFGLDQAPGFDKTGQYPSLTFGPSGLFFNYADGGSGRSAEPALFWFANQYARPDWLLGEHDRLQATVDQIRRSKSSGGNRLLPLTLLWMQDAGEDPTIRMPLNWSSGGETPITIHRSSWTDPQATFLGFKGGSPSASHGQLDIGSFVLDSDGVRWAMDLGAESYHGIESRGMNLWSRGQDSDRWTIFRQSNLGHNTLVIDGQLQRAAGHGTIIQSSDNPRFPHSVLDMSSVYQGQAASVTRGVALLPSREVLVQDEITGLKPGAIVRWGMVTPGEPGVSGKPMIELRKGDAELTLSILTPGASAWTVVDTETPRQEWDSRNRGTCMAACEFTAPDSGRLTIVVLATPGSCGKSVKPELAIRDLQDWPH